MRLTYTVTGTRLRAKGVTGSARDPFEMQVEAEGPRAAREAAIRFQGSEWDPVVTGVQAVRRAGGKILPARPGGVHSRWCKEGLCRCTDYDDEVARRMATAP